MTEIAISAATPFRNDPKATEAQMREAARALEATFLDEMLKSAGLGAMKGAFSGGIGEEQFASFLRASQADAMVEAGGIGLAEHIFRSLAGAKSNA